MSLDLGSGLTSTDGPGDPAGTPSRQRIPRVLAIVHARSGDHLVAALAGLAAQSRQPDVLVAVDCLPATPAGAAAATTDQVTPDPSPVTQPAEPASEPAAARTGEDAFAATFAALTDEEPQAAAQPPVTDSDGAVSGHDELPTGEFTPADRDGQDADSPDAGTPNLPDAGTPNLDDLPTGAQDMDALLRDADGEPVVDQGSTRPLATTTRHAPDPHDVLAAHCDAVITMPAGTTPNAAVAAALAWADSHPEEHDGDSATQDWIWLLGDQDRPSMKALEHLIDSIKVSANLAVVGAKHRAGPTGRDLVDAGLTATRWGRILTQVEPGEPDQGQRDHVADTLAVPLSGMLIRRDVWERLRGLDPALQSLPTLDAAVDLCRRVWLAGHRVEVQPTAVLTAPGRSVPEVSRRARTHRRLAGAPLLAVPLVVLSVVLGGVLRLLAGVVAKEPFRALHHAGASLVPLVRPDQVVQARWRAWRTHAAPRRRLTPLLAGTRQTWRWQRERWQRGRPRLISPAGRDATPPALWKPGLLFLALAVAGVVALLRIARPGAFTSAAMPAVTPDLTGLWHAATSSWVPADLGHPGPADPLLAVLSVLGAPVGSPRLAALALLLLALPAAGWATWWATGGLTRRASIRTLCALAWAGSPVLLLAVAEARLAIVLAAVFLPVAVRALGQSIAGHSRRSVWAWAAAGGLLLVPATVGLPALAVVLVLFLLLVAARARSLALAVAGLPALVMSLPVLLAAIDRPAILFSETGTPLVRDTPPAWAALLGWPVPADTLVEDPATRFAHGVFDPLIGADVVTTLLTVLPWLLGAAAALLALLGIRVLLRGSPRGAVARTGWVLAAAGVVLATVSTWFTVAADQAGTIAGSTSAGTLLAVFGLLVAASAGWGAPGPARTGVLAATGRGLRRLGGVLLATIPILAITGWVAVQALAPAATDVRHGANPPLPASVLDAAASADAVRTVTVRAQPSDGGDLPDLEIAVLRGEGPGLASESSTVTVTDRGSDRADQALADAVVRTVRGDADARELLAPFGIGAIVLLPSVDAQDGTTRIATRLDSTLGLGPSGRVGDVRAWRVNSLSGEASADDRPAAVRIVPAERGDGPAWIAVPSENGTVNADVATTAGTLVLAERYDQGWRATLDGRELTPVRVDGWAQGFEIEPSAGRLVVEHETTWHRVIGWIQVIVLLGALLIALPVRTRGTPSPDVAGEPAAPAEPAPPAAEDGATEEPAPARTPKHRGKAT